MKPLMKTFTAPDGTEYEVCDEVARTTTSGIFKDQITGEQYKIYVSNGKLMMDKVEE